MRNRIAVIKIVAFVLAIGLSGILTTANAASDLSHCADNSRECLVASAMSYINGLTQMNPAKPRFAPNVRRTVEGAKFPTGLDETIGEAALRADMDLNSPAIQKILADRKLSAQEVLAKRKLNKKIIQTIIVDERAGQVVIVWGDTTSENPGKSMERFKIEKGLITEIESLDINRKFSDKTLGWPAVQPCLESGGDTLVPCKQ